MGGRQGGGNPHLGVLIMKSRRGGGEEVRTARRKGREGGREGTRGLSAQIEWE